MAGDRLRRAKRAGLVWGEIGRASSSGRSIDKGSVSSRSLIAALALATACDGASAGPPPPAPIAHADVQPALRAALPAGWIELPDVARAATTAAAEIEGVAFAAAAWGDPALGCYLLAVDLRGAHRDRVQVVVDKLGWHLDAQAAMHEWKPPAAQAEPTEVTARLTVGGLTGALRGVLSVDARSLPRAGLAACFYNDREPRECEQAPHFLRHVCFGMTKRRNFFGK
jgi:hypothetical protein